MKGVLFLGDRQAVVRDFPDPVPGPGQVVVAMKAAAICGSDMHTYRRTAAEIAASPFRDHIPGHEPAGIVAAVGEGVQRVKAGDRVSIYHYLACGHCEHCLAGNMQWCAQRRGLGGPVHGSDADLLLVDERNCLHLPSELSFVDGALIACIAGTVYSALRKLQPSGLDTLAVFGLGPVGLMGVSMGRALGARIIGLDRIPERLQLARDLGAAEVVDISTEEKPEEALRRLTEGRGVDLAFETSGSPHAHRGLIHSLKLGGKGAFVGFGAREPTVNLTEIIGRQLTLMGSFVMPIHYYWELVRFIIGHGLSTQFERMITHRFRLEQAAEAFRLFDTGRTGKVMFEW